MFHSLAPHTLHVCCYDPFISIQSMCLCVCVTCYRVICKLLASKSESIRVQALKVLGYFLKHLGHKSVSFCSLVLCLQQEHQKETVARRRNIQWKEQPLLSLVPFVCACLLKIMSLSSSPGGIIVLTARTGREVEP